MSNIANTSEVIEAFTNLTDEELKALTYAAFRLLEGTQYGEPNDLIHEALHRALDGRRNWPKHISFGSFLNMTMRSISSSERTHAKNAKYATISYDELAEFSDDLGMHAQSAEEVAISMEIYELARKAANAARIDLDGDEPALKVLSGVLMGMSAREMRNEFRLDLKSFDAARHRVYRRLQAWSNQGRHH